MERTGSGLLAARIIREREMFSATRAGVLTSKGGALPSWTFTVSSVLSGYTDPPTKAGMSDGINNQSGVKGWGSSGFPGEWIKADFGISVYITAAKIKCLAIAAPGSWGATYTNGKELQGSNNNTDWTAIATISGLTDSNTITVNVNANYRYLRIYGDGYIGCGDFWFV